MGRCLASAFEVTPFKHLSDKLEWPVLEKAAESQQMVTIPGLATTQHVENTPQLRRPREALSSGAGELWLSSWAIKAGAAHTSLEKMLPPSSPFPGEV